MINEFDLIKRYFHWPLTQSNVVLGPGDDAAIIKALPQGQVQLISTDTFILGVHCPIETSAEAIGYKALAVNLSDLAAMGAKPEWFTLALSLPEFNTSWLESFSRGMRELALAYNIPLVGGDITRGELSITITVAGSAPENKVLKRSGAHVGDTLYVTGYLGQGALGLFSEYHSYTAPLSRKHLDFPVPRIEYAEPLREGASAAMDISDGLLSDLSHLCQSSSVGASIDSKVLPISSELQQFAAVEGDAMALQMMLNGGDDYELLFTVGAENKVMLEKILHKQGLPFYAIGRITEIPAEEDAIIVDGMPASQWKRGYDHFA